MSEDRIEQWIERLSLQNRFVVLMILMLYPILLVGLGFDMLIDVFGVFIGYLPPNFATNHIDPLILLTTRIATISFCICLMILWGIIRLDEMLRMKEAEKT